MSNTKKTDNIEDMINRTKRDKLNLDLDKNHDYDDITKKLEEEKILKYSDLTNDELKVINVKEDLKEFDYFNDLASEQLKEIKDINDLKIEASHHDNLGLVDGEIENAVKIENITLKQEIRKIDRSNGPLIYFDKVKLAYGKDEVIKGVDLKIYKGEFIYFVGKSGAGKSSLIRMIYREVRNTDGRLMIDKENITRYKPRNMPKLRRKVGVIFQDYKLLPDKTVMENVMYSLEVTRFKKSLRKEKVLDTLKRVGIIEKKDKFPNELSGGQQQRVAIARAIVSDPLILVADEPTGNLDPENAIAIMEILKKINERGTTVVMATHDVGIVNKYSNRVVLFKDGIIENEVDGGYIYE